ncbi:MAG TPA: tetratricopeptide repeat protein, partial [Saprospiraceae bacterium]|nr:tetratricopeptide repeat protein [Saprospiraceae bacterium]
MFKKILLILICIYSVNNFAFANVDTLFVKANEAYKSKEFNKAIDLYESILKEDFQSKELFYNLGNSYFKQDQLGKAVLYFEKALLLDPTDEDIQYNLELVKSFSKDEITVLPPFFLARWWGTLRGLASSTLWSIIALVIFWLGVAGIIVWLIAQEREKKKKGFLIGFLLISLSILPFLLAYDKFNLEKDSNMAIVLAKETALKSAPDIESTELLLIHEGTKLELLDEIGEWSKVRLQNGEQGWLPFSTF